MAVQTFTPRGFTQGNQARFIPTLDIPIFDLSQVDQFGNELIEIENDRIDKIEENYSNILDTKDQLLQLDPGTAYGKSILDQKKEEYGIGEDTFKLSMDDLKDPFKQRRIQSSLQSLLNDSQVKDVLRESNEVKKFDDFIKRLERTNPQMALLAKRDLNSVRQDSTGQNSIFSLSPTNYEEINFSDIITEELSKLPADVKVQQKNDGNGFIVFSDVRDFRMTDEEFSELVAEKYADDPRVQNTFRSRIDPSKPESERSVNDPDAVGNYLKQESIKAYNNFDNVVLKNTVREDKIAVDNARTANDIKVKEAQAAASSGASSGTTPTFSANTFGKFGANVGNNLSRQGFNVGTEELLVLDKLFEEGDIPTKEQKEDGSVVYTVENDLGEKQEVARFTKTPVSEGFIGTAAQERELNQNRVIARQSTATKNMVQTVRNNPIVRGRDGVSEGPLQDVFFDEVMMPQYIASKNRLESDPEFVEKAAEKGIFGNKLFYLLHHNGEGKAKEYVLNGTAPIKGNDQSDAEIEGAFRRAEAQFGENWDDVPTSEYIKHVESLGQYDVIYRGPANSSAFGAYQFTLSNWGKKLQEFVDDRVPTQTVTAIPKPTRIGSLMGIGSGSNQTNVENETTSDSQIQESINSTEPKVEIKKSFAERKIDKLNVEKTQLLQDRQSLIDNNIFEDDLGRQLRSIDNKVKDIEESIIKNENSIKSQEEFQEFRLDFINKSLSDLKPGVEKEMKAFNSIGQGAMRITMSNTEPPLYRVRMGNDLKEPKTREELVEFLRSFAIFSKFKKQK